MSGLRRQLARVTRLEQRRQTRSVSRIVFVSPGEWPPEDEAAYWAAERVGDQAVMDDLVERHTGHRPARQGAKQLVVLLREVPGGPR